jgi:uncharacterized repeat protein (TIGR01451 family)
MLRSYKTSAVNKTIVSALLIFSIIFSPGFSNITYGQATEDTDQSTSEVLGSIAESGDATAGTEIVNEVNNDIIEADTTEDDTSDEVPIETSETQDEDSENTDEPLSGTVGNEVINTGEVLVDSDTSAKSGSTTASGQTSVALSGEAVAYVDVLNVVNTNIIDSAGLIDFINGTLGYEDFDLRPTYDLIYSDFETAVSTDSCVGDGCGQTQPGTTTENNATIENNILVKATSGNSTSTATDTALAGSGNAYATANIINLANTNITDSQYLLLVFNNFADYAGDIVLPSSSFFEKMFNSTTSSLPHNVLVENEAVIEDNVVTEANSGDANAEGENALALTGDAKATSLISNTINQTLVGATNFSLLIRVHGDWTGDISGLPEGMSWRETDEGVEVFYTGDNSGSPSSLANKLASTNQATIKNDVQVFALSGDSQASGEEATAVSGDAYADSSIMNIVNTNVISSNWSKLIFTIYGDWNGNLTFGQPDLWLGIQAESDDQPIMPGSVVDYTFTVFNQGDAKARNVSLEGLFEAGALSFTEGTTAPGQTNWSLGDILPNETKEITYRAKISSALEASVVSAIPLTGRVKSTDKESDYENNEDVITVYVGHSRNRSSSDGKRFPAKFDITKTADKTQVEPGETVKYTITLFNRGGELSDALLVDSLMDENDEAIITQSWPLGNIKNWETITISYSILYDQELEFGKYTNSAQLIGFHGSSRPSQQTAYESPIVSYDIRYGDGPQGEVLGISTNTCEPYLTDYMRYGWNNRPSEVEKLQLFLNQHQNSSLLINGFFGPQTEQAVRQFQQKYQSEILDPWGDPTPSGFVFYTTRRKINELQCNGLREFPLSAKQQVEILLARSNWYQRL